MHAESTRCRIPHAAACVAWAVLWTHSALAASLGEVRQMLAQGDYADCLAAARESGSDRPAPSWSELEIKAQLVQGRYVEALASFTLAYDRFPFDLGLRMLGCEAYRHNNRPAEANALLRETLQLVQEQPRRVQPGRQSGDGRAFVWSGRLG